MIQEKVKFIEVTRKVEVKNEKMEPKKEKVVRQKVKKT
jgi:hypothetical protein